MRFYAVIDTNVLVSALLNQLSTPGQIISEVANGTIIPLYSKGILAEYDDVLRRPRFPFDREDVAVVLDGIQEKGVQVEAGQISFEVKDPDDVIFYAVVMEKRKTEDAYLVTGNTKHFPIVPYVVTPREMLDIIEASRWDVELNETP